MNKYVERLYNGIIKENPTFVLMLGMCPTLAVTSSAINGLGMGLSTTVVLILSNMIISAFRKVIPNGVRMPAYIVIVASLVTIVQFMMAAYLPSLSAALGVYIPLIVVNCIILGRAESYASKNDVVSSAFDGIGMGLGFTLGLTMIGLIREILGAGTAFNVALSELPGPTLGASGLSVIGLVIAVVAIVLLVLVALQIKKKGGTPLTTLGAVALGIVAVVGFIGFLGKAFTSMTIFIMAPGAFLVLAFLVAMMNIIRDQMEHKGTPLAKPSGCISGDCASCSMHGNCADEAAKSENQ